MESVEGPVKGHRSGSAAVGCEALSPVDDAFVDLLAGPFDKVSITMPSALRAAIANRAVEKGFSAYVCRVLAREERRLALIAFLDDMDERFGPPSDEQMAATDALLEEMWAKYDARSAQSSSTPPR